MRTRGFHWFVAMRYLRGAQFTPSTRVAMPPRGADATLGGEVVAEAARNRYRRKFGPFGRPLHWIARRFSRGQRLNTTLWLLAIVCVVATTTYELLKRELVEGSPTPLYIQAGGSLAGITAAYLGLFRLRAATTVLRVLTGVAAAALIGFVIWHFAAIDPSDHADPWRQRTTGGAIIAGAAVAYLVLLQARMGGEVVLVIIGLCLATLTKVAVWYYVNFTLWAQLLPTEMARALVELLWLNMLGWGAMAFCLALLACRPARRVMRFLSVLCGAVMITAIATRYTAFDSPAWMVRTKVAAILAGALGFYLVLLQLRRASEVLLALTGICLAALMAFLLLHYAFLEEPKPFHPLDPFVQISALGAIVGGALMTIIGSLTVMRWIFSFNSTVSIFGVWIGTMALVFVLSVMSGFESDLRQKILGSNAHIQISKVDGKGEFTEWEDIQAKVKRVPGVVASTPFATTEVVIAANNNYFNVVVKGIDPTSIGAVTHLIDDLECGESKCTPAEAKEVMSRLDPLIDEHDDLEVPQTPPANHGGTTDEAPPDMVIGTDPIDYSGANGGGSGSGSAGSDDDRGGDGDDDTGDPDTDTGDDGDTDVMPPSDFGGDARRVLGPDAAVVDPAPTDMDVPSDTAPEDFSGGGDDDDAHAGGGSGGGDDDDDDTATVTIEPNEFSPPSRRAKMLDGILVGRELTKQIHLYTDQEVKLVSPITNPANPDANGTPIPYNRDYRIAGTFFTGMYEYDLKFVYMTLDSLQTFLDRGDAIDGIEVRIGDPDDTSSVLAAIQRAIGPDYKVQDWQELNRSLFSALKLEKIAMFLVLAIIILVASFSIVGNLVMVVVEKGKEIALLKTLGASDRGVTWIFVTQGFFIGLIGTGVGVAYGLLGCVLAKRFGIPINPDVYYIDKLPIHIDMSSVILIAAAGVLISVGATVYPALVASRLAPSVGLRH